jgi:nucleoside-diphosphate-sugar epimerase
MKVVVTGGRGLIGSSLISRLAERHEVIALSRTEPAQGQRQNVRFVRGDLTESRLPEELPSPIDGVVHLAQSLR